MIDWSLAPEGADSIKANPANVLRWFKGNLKYVETGGFVDGFNNNCEWKTIATRPKQTKTVADAVEQEQPHFKATRENLEKIAKDAQGDFVEVEQESEKWTHELWGDKAYIKVGEPDCDGYLVVVTEGDGYNLAKMEDLKPIKPTISESEMMERIKYRAISIDDDDEFGAKVRAWLDEYDII